MYQLVPLICTRYEGKITSKQQTSKYSPLTENQRKIQEILRIDAAKHPHTFGLAKIVLNVYGQTEHTDPLTFVTQNTIGNSNGEYPLSDQLRTYWKNYFQSIEMDEHAFYIGLCVDKYKIPTPNRLSSFHDVAALHWLLSGHSSLFRETFANREKYIGQLPILDGLLLGTMDDTTGLHKLLEDWGRSLNPSPMPKEKWSTYITPPEEHFYERLLSL